MALRTDLVDWLGGYPYEFATIREIVDFCARTCSLTPVKVIQIRRRHRQQRIRIRAPEPVNDAGRRELPTRFVLLSTQRSGTSWLMERLASHPEIGAYGELLLADRRGWPDWPPGAGDRPFYETYLEERGKPTCRWSAHRHLYAFLDYLYRPRSNFRAIGFKLMYNSTTRCRRIPRLLSFPPGAGVASCASQPARHRTVTDRGDIAAACPRLVRDRAGAADCAGGHALSPQAAPTARVPAVHRSGRAACIARPVREVTYEGLLDGDAPLRRSLVFLGVSDSADVDLTAQMLKLAPLSHRTGIANFDEVARCLIGTRYERFLRRT